MNSLVFAAAVSSLLTLAFAQPHGHRHVHPRVDVTDYVIDYVTDYVIVTAPEVVVWVDDRGSTVSIETRTQGVASSTSVPVSTPSTSDASARATLSAQTSAPVPLAAIPSSSVASPSPTSTEAPATMLPSPGPGESTSSPPPSPGSKEAPTNALTASSSDATPLTDGPLSGPVSGSTTASAQPTDSAPPPSTSQGAAHQPQDSASGFGITWSPYTPDSACKSQGQANSEFAQLAGAGFSMIRIYGIDCNQVAMAIAGVSPYNMAVFAGLVNLDNLTGNLASMITQVGSNWHVIDTVSIGNELVNNGLDPAAVVAALNVARPILNAAGYAGRIVTVDVFDQLISHPELCTASDYCAANCHAFFDNQITAEQAGNYVLQAFTAVGQSNPGKQVMITESGWPWSGAANGAAVPSPANQQTALGDLRAAFANRPGSLMLFDSYDSLWKQPGPFSVEQYFGLYGHP